MALTNRQKILTRHFLGYPGIANQLWAPELNGAFQLLDADEDAVTEVAAILTRLEGVETALEGALKLSGLKSADEGEVEFFGEGNSLDRRQTLQAHGKRLVAKLSTFLGVAVVNDVFSSSAYSGNGWFWVGSHPFAKGV